MISFDVTKPEMAVIKRIVARAKKRWAQDIDGITLMMDLTATHANGCPLRLNDLLIADELNFAHDILGIRKHMNRDTGKLEDFFSPRYSVR